MFFRARMIFGYSMRGFRLQSFTLLKGAKYESQTTVGCDTSVKGQELRGASITVHTHEGHSQILV